MISGRVVIIAVIILGLLPLGAVLDPPLTGAKGVTDPFEGPNGLLWADPVQVTDNDFDDQFPSIRVDGDGMANIVYLQSGAEYMWAELDPPSTVQTTDKRLMTGYIPTQYQVKNESTPQPTDYFDIGPDGSIHVVWTEAGLLDNRYRRFDDTGEPTGEVVHMNQIVSLSRLPFLVVGDNGRAYIAFENEGTAWVQMTYVDDEGYVRAPKLIGRPGENVAYGRGPGDVLHLFYRSLGADVSMFHVKLDEDRRPIVPNDVLFPNTSKIANPYSSMPVITVTPNGHVHILLSETTIAPHPIHYFELDETGTQVIRDVQLVDRAYNYGDIVGDPDNDVYIFWDDYDDGEVHYLKVTDGEVGEEAVITSTGGKARYPQVISDSVRGDVHLTYVDSTDGDGEVFYRYANSYRLDLKVKGLEDGLEVHPGGDVIDLEVMVTNIGEVSNEVTVSASVEYNGLEAKGWSFDLVETTDILAGGETMTVPATLTGPVSGIEGEHINVTVSAVPKRSVAKMRTVDFTSTLTIAHSLRLSGPSMAPLEARWTDIPLGLSNQGDVEEDVNITVTGGLPGWETVLEVSNTTLPPNGVPLELFLNVTLPVWEKKDIVARLTLVAVSSSDPPAYVRHDIQVITYPSVYPVLFPEYAYDWVEPGNVASKTIHVINEGSVGTTFDLSFVVHRAIGEWDIDLSTTQLTVGPGEEVTFDLFTEAPKRATAGHGLTVEVIALDPVNQVWSPFVYNVFVEEMKGIQVLGGGDATVFPGETAVFEAMIVNHGNAIRELELSVLSLPSGWSWHYGDGQGLSSIAIDPYHSKVVDLLVTPPLDAPPGEVAVLGTVDDQGDLHPIDAKVLVQQAYGTTVDSDIPIKKATLGTQVSFRMSVNNTGTAMESYALVTEGLPLYGTSKFLVNGSLTETLSVLPGEAREVEVLLELPTNMKAVDFDFQAGVRSNSGQAAFIDLFVEFRLADLKVKDVLFDAKDINAGDKTEVKVRVGNSGDAFTDGVIVNVNGKTQAVSVPTGGEKEVTFNIVFDGSDTQLIVVVDPGNDFQERNEDNNAYFQKVEVSGGGTGFIPGFDIVGCILGFILLVTLTALKRYD